MTKMINPAMQNQMIAPNQRIKALAAAGQASGQVMPAVMPSVMPITANTTMVQPTMAAAQPQLGVPATGLIGSEQALSTGYQGALGDLQSGFGQAQKALTDYSAQLGGAPIPQVGNGSLPSFGAMPKFNTALGADVKTPLNEAAANFGGYMDTGNNASKMQADLTGVNGPEAQAAAQAAYKDSPALQYQMDQMQRITERSAAARGGALGGNVLLELQKNAQGLASQDYFNQLGALGSQADRGLSAAGQVGNIKSTQAGIAGNLQQAGLNAQSQIAAQREGITGNILAQREQMTGNILAQREQMQGDIASRLSSLAESSGINAAGLKTGYASAVAGGRTQAGQAIAANAGQAASNISQILKDQGIAVSDMISKDISTITDMIYQSGMQDKTDMQNLAALLANINGGQATNVMQGNMAIGDANAAGIIGANNAVQQGTQNYIGYQGLGAK